MASSLRSLLILLILVTACTQDFDQFRPPGTTRDTTGGKDANQPLPDGGVITLPDGAMIFGDMIVTRDMPPVTPAVPVGKACQDASECGPQSLGPQCREGVCTVSCDATKECSKGNACVPDPSNEQVRFCAPRCDASAGANACEAPGSSCVEWLFPERFSSDWVRATPRQGEAVCIRDKDGDTILDTLDRCPEAKFARLGDRDADGLGDECDPSPLCHARMTQGEVTLNHSAITWPLRKLGLPALVYGPLIPLIGGLDPETGKPSPRRALLDRRTGVWQELEPSPVSASGVSVVVDNLGGWLATPGFGNNAMGQEGRVLQMFQDAKTQQTRTVLDTNAYTQMAFARRRTGGMMVLTTQQSGPSQIVRIGPYTLDSSLASASFGALSGPTTWHATSYDGGGVAFYSEPQPGEIGTPTEGLFSIAIKGFFGPDSTAVVQEQITLMAPIKPLLMVTATGARVLWDRSSGAGYMLRVTQDPSVYVPVAVPELNMAPVSADAYVVVAPDVPALLVFEADMKGEMGVREISFGCKLKALTYDSDMDGVPDLRDNCISEVNADQLDTDGDGRGDRCDEDDDDDGILDAEDVRTVSDAGGTMTLIPAPKDTDNDGIDNALDPDDDADGTPDEEDRFPLDTDNDGKPNALDSDDDDDGDSDEAERTQGSDPLDPMDFPQSGRLVYIRVTPEGVRTVEWITFKALVQRKPAIPIPALGTRAYAPSISALGASVLVLNGAPQSATGVGWSQLVAANAQPTTPARQVELGAPQLQAIPQTEPLVGVGGEALRGVTHIQRNSDGIRTSLYSSQVSVFVPKGIAATQVLLERPGEVSAVYRDASSLQLVAAPPGCLVCRTGYQFNEENSSIKATFKAQADLSWVKRNTSERWAKGSWVNEKDEPEERIFRESTSQPIDPPPGNTSIGDLVPMSRPGRALATVRQGEMGPSQIWFTPDGGKNWVRMTESAQSLEEVDWKP